MTKCLTVYTVPLHGMRHYVLCNTCDKWEVAKFAKCERKEIFDVFDRCKQCILNALAKPDVIVNNYWHTFTTLRILL